MLRRSHQLLALLVLTLATCGGNSRVVLAQDAPPQAAPRFAPGVLTTIPPDVDREDTVSIHDVIELRADADLDRTPNLTNKQRVLFEMAHDTGFRRDVWCLEFTFKPLRMMYVDVPQPDGRMQRKLIWYMVYRVRNTGAGLTPVKQEDGTFAATDHALDELRFTPQFLLTSRDVDRQGEPIRKTYLDRIIPSAVVAIERREFSGRTLLNSVEMGEEVLKAESGRMIGGKWGVATWEDVDPEIDFFSVYVRGLTNAYDWQDDVEDFAVGDPAGKGRKFARKQLQLNFWRPGDALAENEREIRFGAAPGKSDRYGVSEGVAYQWIYR